MLLTPPFPFTNPSESGFVVNGLRRRSASKPKYLFKIIEIIERGCEEAIEKKEKKMYAKEKKPPKRNHSTKTAKKDW